MLSAVMTVLFMSWLLSPSMFSRTEMTQKVIMLIFLLRSEEKIFRVRIMAPGSHRQQNHEMGHFIEFCLRSPRELTTREEKVLTGCKLFRCCVASWAHLGTNTNHAGRVQKQ